MPLVLPCKAKCHTVRSHTFDLQNEVHDLNFWQFISFTDNSSAEMSSQEIDFHSRQYALYFALAFEVMAAFFFLLTTIYVVSDRQKAEEAEKLAAASNGAVSSSTNYKENGKKRSFPLYLKRPAFRKGTGVNTQH